MMVVFKAVREIGEVKEELEARVQIREGQTMVGALRQYLREITAKNQSAGNKTPNDTQAA